MRWNSGHESPDVVDRRGQRSGGLPMGGLIAILPFLLRSKLGWAVLVIGGALYYFGAFGRAGGDVPSAPGTQRVAEPRAGTRNDDDLKHFVSFVLDDVQDTWTREMSGQSTPYRRAKLVLFTDATQTACGTGASATGPFYCPRDERAYIDLGFYKQLESRLGAAGDFAQAYVIAHEIGHHVQNILGTSDKVHKLRGSTQGEAGASVRLELQADCYAGVWGHSTAQRKILEGGDLDEALRAAAAIGDDRLQRQATGTVSPEKWTHGSSAERARWFKRGFDSGDMKQCDTFAAREL